MRGQGEDDKLKVPQLNDFGDTANFLDNLEARGIDWMNDARARFERMDMVNISVRIPREDLFKIKENAQELGIGYTALIRMIIHQYASGRR
ncbi:MAG: hypothetical protein HPY50_21195 [Firmicutes bacterium]|nr:hypothetical protein [Bacillota bacterium]